MNNIHTKVIMNVNYSKYIYILFLIQSCTLNFSVLISFQNNHHNIDQNHTITVYVHGTYPMKKLLQYTPFRRLTYCPQGLSLIQNMPKKYHFYKMASHMIDLEPLWYNWKRFYIFGWKSEKVYDYVRVNAAQDLVDGLRKIVDNYYQEHHILPSIKLIGFSHGGNVVLHTAQFLPICVDGQDVKVQVWLFGTPVQQINKHLVNSSYFLQVYSFYSTKDWLQRMDPQGIWDKTIDKKFFWSDRMFNDNDRCVQVNFTVNNKSISHSYYRSIFKYFPLIEKEVLASSSDINSGMITINLVL